MSNFGKEQLWKYGWTEGKGLGKNEDGITKPLKPTLKFDTIGLGYRYDLINPWELYLNAIKNNEVNQNINSDNNKILQDVADHTQETNIFKNNEKSDQSKFKNFVKTSTLHDGRLVQDACTESEEEKTIKNRLFQMSDEQLFKACGSRTMHQAARLGLTLNGKLSRIEAQDAMLGVINTNTSGMCQTNPCLVKENMIHRKSNIGSDTDEDQETQSDTTEVQPEIESTDYITKSKTKRQRKKMNKLMQQLHNCNINENDKESTHILPGGTSLCWSNFINRHHSTLFHNNKTSALECKKIDNVATEETRDRNTMQKSSSDNFYKIDSFWKWERDNETKKNKRSRSQERSVTIEIEPDIYSYKSKKFKKSDDGKNVAYPYTEYKSFPKMSRKEERELNYFQKNTRKNEDSNLLDKHEDSVYPVNFHICSKHLYTKKIKEQINQKHRKKPRKTKKESHKAKKKEQRKATKEQRQFWKRKTRLDRIIQKLVIKCSNNNNYNIECAKTNALIENFSTINLTDDVSATIKKKLTQTHLTPV